MFDTKPNISEPYQANENKAKRPIKISNTSVFLRRKSAFCSFC